MPPQNRRNRAVTGPTRTLVVGLQWVIFWLARYWFLVAMLLTGTVLALGFLAPSLMAQGHTGGGLAIYRFLAAHNHQLPQRSYFLFGELGPVQTYSLNQILEFGADADQLQAFMGNSEVGYKTALNHRMIAIFVGIFGGGLIWGLAGQRPRLSFVWFLAMALPLLLDGVSHMVSESSGEGFRQSNSWAITLTGGLFGTGFYSGAGLRSLNWWLRTLTGLLFGLGLAWFLFSYLSRRFLAIRVKLEPRFSKNRSVQ